MAKKHHEKAGDDKKELRKREILVAALEVFSEKGYEKAAMDDIASKAGIAKGTLYLYYKDKRDIFNKTIIFVVDNFIEVIKSIVDSDLSPERKIGALIKKEVRYFLDNSHLFNLFQMAFQENLITSNEELLKDLFLKKNKIINLISEIINEAKQKGIIKSYLDNEDIIIIIDGFVTSILRSVRVKTMRIRTNDNKEASEIYIEKRLDNSIKIIFEGILTDEYQKR